MPNRLLLACLLALSSSTAAAADPAPDAGAEAEATEPGVPFLGGFLRETRIVYPLRLGPWTARDEHRYDTPEAGVSVRYADDAHDDRWIDVYFYPVGVLTADQVATVAEQEREALLQSWFRDREAGDDIGALHAFELAPAPDPVARAMAGVPVPEAVEDKREPRKAYSVDLVFESDGIRRSSAMVVLFDRLYMVKSRFSVKQEAVSREEVRRQLQRFTTDLVAGLAISSSGACWQPLRIEPLDPAAEAPDGALFTIDTDGQPSERVYPDRVLARDPGSDTARLAMILGMSMQQRLYGGCDGAEPSNPEVTEGRREIRIEYPAPDGKASPARNTHGSRAGFG